MVEAILGISAFYHESATAIVVDGKIAAAAQEEQFIRIKQDASFPRNTIKYVLEESSVTFEQLAAIAFYEKPFIRFEHLLETYHVFAPSSLGNQGILGETRKPEVTIIFK